MQEGNSTRAGTHWHMWQNTVPAGTPAPPQPSTKEAQLEQGCKHWGWSLISVWSSHMLYEWERDRSSSQTGHINHYFPWVETAPSYCPPKCRLQVTHPLPDEPNAWIKVTVTERRHWTHCGWDQRLPQYTQLLRDSYSWPTHNWGATCYTRLQSGQVPTVCSAAAPACFSSGKLQSHPPPALLAQQYKISLQGYKSVGLGSHFGSTQN